MMGCTDVSPGAFHIVRCLSQISFLAAFVSGPGVTKMAMILFMNNTASGRPKAGIHVGVANRSVTVEASRGSTQSWIRRDSVGGKQDDYAVMGMKHFSKSGQKDWTASCYEQIYKDTAKEMIDRIT
jgi:hypothetical protein